jgi:enoyl-CoA hydratase/carnithine racemase
MVGFAHDAAMSGTIRRTEDAGVLTMTLTRDEKLNAVSDDMLETLGEAVEELGDRRDLRVLVITAEGRYFTAGLDISAGLGKDASSGVAYRREYRRIHQIFDDMESVEKPVIHAAQGPCLGVGVEMAVSCDFRLCSDRTVFGLPELANLAVIPGSGGISRLTRLVGPHWARWLAMAGQQVDAQQGVTIGLVHQVLPTEDFADSVQAFAHRLAGMSREALGLAKLAIDAATTADRRSARDFDRISNTLLKRSDEHLAAMDAFKSRARKS